MRWLFNWICGERVKNLENTIKLFGNNIDRLEGDLQARFVENKKLREKFDECEESLIEAFKQIPAPVVETKPPEWLDENGNCYKPAITCNENGKQYNIVIDPLDIYTESYTLEVLVENYGWRDMEKDEKLTSIWRFVIENFTYQFDITENWQFPVETFYRRKGDCEDTTILFVTLCKMSGIKADEIFNVVGYVTNHSSKYLHSYPIVKMEDGKWYIMETTLPLMGIKKLFFDSRYTADIGMSNWKFKGGIKDGKMQI